MGLPAKKRTKQQKRERRGNIFLTGISLTKGEKGDTVKLPHRVSPSGYYKGRDVLQLELKAERKKIRQKKREKKSSST